MQTKERMKNGRRNKNFIQKQNLKSKKIKILKEAPH
jgi:chemotaxis receptor (MCP) glutamine deamidase CheD